MSNVRNAVEKADEAVARAPAEVSPATLVRQAIEQQSSAFRQVLPRHVDPERYARLVITAVKAAPDLMHCFETHHGKTSVLLAAMQCAAIGLEPNTPTQEAWLLPRKNTKANAWECQLYVGYRGYLKLARRSPVVKTVVADVVRDGDHFRWERGLESDVLEHKAAEEGEGELQFAYAIVRYTNGGYNYVVLNRRQVEARRAMSDSWKNERARPYSPWTKWPERQWMKTAIRSLAPFMDLTPESEVAMTSDERSLSFDDEAGVIEVVEAIGELTGPTDERTEETEPNETEGQGELAT